MTETKRYECDRCGVPTKSVFEGETMQDDFNSQLDGGLRLTVSGYYGGFWDTLPMFGEEPLTLHLCHDCSAWLCREIPAMSEQAKGGHFSSNVQETQAIPAGPCCEWGVADHQQGDDPTGAYDNPKERIL